MNEMGYLDFHSHILPGVDDGAKTPEMTKEMLRLAYQQGIRTMMATPHNYPGSKNKSPEELQEKFAQVQKWAKEIGEDFTVLLGNEIFYRKSICDDLEKKDVFTMGQTDYVLVEFSPYEKYSVIYAGLKELVETGYYPVVAHMERVESLLMYPERINELIRLGCYMQVNCESLFGGFFDSVTNKLWKYMKNRQIHFLGSDCHNMKDRKPVMRDCVNRLYKKLPREIADWLVYENHQKFLMGKYIK